MQSLSLHERMIGALQPLRDGRHVSFRAWIVAGIVIGLVRSAAAESIEKQSNPVARGAIQVASGNFDRSDWKAIPSYEEDLEDSAEPNNYRAVQVANDDRSLYLRFSMAESAEFGFRHNVYLDVDQSRDTGFIGTGVGFLSLGAEYLIQGGSVFHFSAPAQNEWGWTWIQDGVFDQLPLTDIELKVDRASIGNPPALDFVMNAANFDLGTPEDYYPDTGASPLGDFLTYEFGTVAALIDIDELSAAIRTVSTDAKYDLNHDTKIDALDRSYWVETIRKTYFGDANLDGEFNSADFVVIFEAGEYEDAIAGNSTWREGDWNGDGDFASNDFVAAFQGAGYEVGPRTAVAAVPEPASISLGLALAVGCGGWVRRQRRSIS